MELRLIAILWKCELLGIHDCFVFSTHLRLFQPLPVAVEERALPLIVLVRAGMRASRNTAVSDLGNICVSFARRPYPEKFSFFFYMERGAGCRRHAMGRFVGFVVAVCCALLLLLVFCCSLAAI